MAAVDNPSGKPSEDNTVVFRAVWASLLTQKNKVAAEFVQKLLKEETIMLLQQKTKIKDLLIKVKRLFKGNVNFLKVCVSLLFHYIYNF